ncbi:MAG: thiol-disulfide oxidoreductase DCC family protein, partial [Candidatus Zixiibacteriota bacterium]
MRPVILFDGICCLCSRLVQFIHARDTGAVYRFAPLQSEAARELLRDFQIPHSASGAAILVDGERLYTQSDAALRAVRRLSGLWPLLFVLIVIPTLLRDYLYLQIARRRYAWFGRLDSCFAPS